MNEEGYALLRQFEGLRLQAYQDLGGVWTIGIGHVGNVTPGMVITEEVANRLFLIDVAKTQLAIKYAVKAVLNSNQLSAAIMFAFNVKGWAHTPLFKLLSEGHFEAAKQHWLLYDHVTVDGKKIEEPGLKLRRQAELELFCKSIKG